MSTQPLSSIHAQFLRACEDKLKQIGYIDPWGKELPPEIADMKLPKSIFHFRNDSLNERQIRDAQPLWRDIWFENECVCLFGDPNVGKSTLALDIASEVANTGRNVLYFDLENMMHNYFQRGWSCIQGMVPDNLFIRHFDQDTSVEEMINYKTILDSIERDIYYLKAPVIVIDDIAQICTLKSCNKTHIVLRRLRQLLNQYHVSILVVAHATHHQEGTPLAMKHLTGDRQLAYAFDSIFTLSEIPSTVNHLNGATHYIKQLKARNSPLKAYSELVTTYKMKLLYDDEACRKIVDQARANGDDDEAIKRHIEFVIDRKCLRFEHIDDNVNETQLLYLPDSASDENKLSFIHDTFARGWSIRNIAAHCNTSKSTVHRLLSTINNEEKKEPKLSQDQDLPLSSSSEAGVKVLRASVSQQQEHPHCPVVGDAVTESEEKVKLSQDQELPLSSSSEAGVKVSRASVSQQQEPPHCPVVGDAVTEGEEEKKEPKLSQGQELPLSSASQAGVKVLRASVSQQQEHPHCPVAGDAVTEREEKVKLSQGQELPLSSASQAGVKVLRASVSQQPEQPRCSVIGDAVTEREKKVKLSQGNT